MKFEELEGWVSIMVPCYNGEQFVEQFLINISEQTYSKIHLIFIDDGSTDKTRDLFMQFKYLLENRNMRWEYHYQKNQGQAAAINVALSRVCGEYCSWLDIDDFITKNHIEKKVERLAKEKDLGIVICKGIAVDENPPYNKRGELSTKGPLGCLFENILFDYASCVPGLYMARSKFLFEALGGKSIYPSRVGQNFQLLLPILYWFKIGYINEVLFFYRIRMDSHSHCIKGENEWQNRITLVEDVKKNVLSHMSLPEVYLETLLDALKFKILQWKIDKMIEYSDIQGESKFAYMIITDFFSNFLDISKKEFWIWGETEKNNKLSKLIETYGKVKVKGFIDSNPTKVEKRFYQREVISPDNLDINTMVLLVPLKVHKEIVYKLNEKGFYPRKDYIYPEYEIERLLKRPESKIC